MTMHRTSPIVAAAALLAVLAATPARATLEFSARQIAQHRTYVDTGWIERPLSADWMPAAVYMSGTDQLLRTQATLDKGLTVRYFHDPSGSGSAQVAMRGQVQISGPDGFVDTTLTLGLGGHTELTGVIEGTQAWGTHAAFVRADAQEARWVVEKGFSPPYSMWFNYGYGVEPGAVNTTLSPLGALTAQLRLPVGRPFTLELDLQAWGDGWFQNRTDVDYRLYLFPGQTFFDLPAGYDVASADWGVAGNRWCGSGCIAAPVPEPATAGLWLAGGALLVALRQRRGARS